MSEVSTCLWFGKDAESAVRFYVSIVPGSTIDHIQRSPGAWPGERWRRHFDQLSPWGPKLPGAQRRRAGGIWHCRFDLSAMR